MGGYKYTGAERQAVLAELAARYEAGESIDSLRIDYPNADKWLKEAGVKSRPRGAPRTNKLPRRPPVTEEEFTDLYREHSDMLHRYFRRDFPCPHARADVVALTFEALWRYRDNIVEGTSLVGTLWHYAKQQRSRVWKERREYFEWVEEGKRALQYMSVTDDYPDVDYLAALRRIPPVEREVLWLLTVEGMNDQAIAEYLGCKRSKVTKLLQSAVICIRQQPGIAEHFDKSLTPELWEYRPPRRPAALADRKARRERVAEAYEKGKPLRLIAQYEGVAISTIRADLIHTGKRQGQAYYTSQSSDY